MIRLSVCLFSMALAALAQIPGQYPGQTPRLPGQTPPLPGQTGPAGQPPGRQPDTRPSRSSGKNVSPATTTTGIFRRVSPSQLVIEAGDHRVIWYQFSSTLPVKKDGKEVELNSFTRGDTLTVNSNEDDDGILTAVAVTWQKAATPEDKAAAAKDWDLPKLSTPGRANTSASSPVREPGDDRPVIRRKDAAPKADEPPKQDSPKEVAVAQPPEQVRPTTVMRPPDAKPDEDDPGPPALRRGVPAPKRPTNEESTTASTPAPVTGNATPPATPGQARPAVQPPAAPAQTQPPQAAPPPEDSVIVKARDAAALYSDTLPNFFVQQFATRYQSDAPKADWRALDIVSADVAYENGRETYKNIKIGNKVVNKPMEDIEGSRSTGEFATFLETVMEEPGATFRRKGQDTIRNRSAWIYTYEVPREMAHWRIESPSQLYYPALRGSIWIDRETSRILRIEQQARDMPKLFPFDTVETAADYDFVRLGTTGPFLLPVEAEVLTCIRGTSVCSRNKIEFRNYRKFGSDTNITFGDQQ